MYVKVLRRKVFSKVHADFKLQPQILTCYVLITLFYAVCRRESES